MHNAKTRITQPLTVLAVMALLLMITMPPMLNGARAAKTEAKVATSSSTSTPLAMPPAASGCTGVSFSQPAGSPLGVGGNPRSVAVGDFNQDGKPDLATANANSNNVTILLGDGSGGFSQAAGSPVGVGTTPFSVAVGDFNLDGKTDLAVANQFSDNVTILLGNGSGGFSQAAGSPFGAGSAPRSVAVGDFNLDGKADLATANFITDNVTILLGNGSGGFTQAVGSPIGVGNGPFSVAVGDFNQDGKPDLVTANNGSNTVTILLGDGSGGFTEAAGSPVGAGSIPVSVAVGDFNQDGKTDLAVANEASNNVTILLGNGSGGFTQAVGSPIGVGNGPFSVAVGDFNQDGKVDIATANQNSNNVTILLGNGSSGFTQPAGSPVGVGSIPVSVAVGDFNQDGKADLTTANFNSTNVTILLNTCTANTPPTITATPLSRNAGSPSANSQIATVGDAEEAENLLTITVNSSASATVTGVTVSGISVSAAGLVTANVVAACDAMTANFTLRVSDSGGLFNEAMLTVTVNPDNQPPTLTCPANLTQATDANLCSAVVSYAAPKVADNCPGVGAALCTPASGSAFPKGTTTVNCSVSDASKNQATCSFTVTVNDTQPPTLTCPANVTAVTNQAVCVPPGQTACQIVNFATPTATDNCPKATVACNPPSGSCFPTGVTTVTCTATDAAGNTANCSFTLMVFDVCLQDDNNANTVLLFNSLTGDYRFCCNGTIFTGRGKVTRQGCTITLDHIAADRRVLGKADKSTFRGNGYIQTPPGSTKCAITDRDIRNNACTCQ